MEQTIPVVPWDKLQHLADEGVWHLASTSNRTWEVVVKGNSENLDKYLLQQAQEVCEQAALYCELAVSHLQKYSGNLAIDEWCVGALRFEVPNSFIAELSNEADTYGFWTVLMEGSRFDGGATTYRPTKLTRTQD